MTTAKECFDLIAKMDMMDIKVLGDVNSQKTYIYSFLSDALTRLAHIGRWVKIADPLNITSDGYKSFTIGGQPIDMYAPLRLLDSTDYSVNNRTSFAHPQGWYREGASQQIHTKGITGVHTLHYVANPAKVADDDDVVEFPPQGKHALCFYTVGIIKNMRNAYQEAEVAFAQAEKLLKVVVLANESARGRGADGYVASVNDVNAYFKG